MTPLAAYILLFLAVGIGFIFVHLMAGKLIRPNKPDPSKRTIYECGEPTIGSAWIQFDLRFYVVALLFVIFDVEVAFFFPWAEVFGKANALAAVGTGDARSYHETADRAAQLIPPAALPEHAIQLDLLREITPEDLNTLHRLQQKQKSRQPLEPGEAAELDRLAGKEKLAEESQRQARTLAWLSLVEIGVFFGVLLVGFAYLWVRGDLAWVRSLAAERPGPEAVPAPAPPLVRQPAAAPLAGTVAHS